jgi:hypothetical protein
MHVTGNEASCPAVDDPLARVELGVQPKDFTVEEDSKRKYVDTVPITMIKKATKMIILDLFFPLETDFFSASILVRIVIPREILS